MRVLCFIAAISSLPVLAEVYKVVDAQGNITYTDQPQPESQLAPLALPPVDKIPAADPGPANRGNQPEATQFPQSAPFTGYAQAYILSPQHDQIIPNQQRNIIIQLRMQPQLQPGHRVLFVRNGQPCGPPVSATAYQLDDLERGTHQISAQILSAQGRVLLSLEPVSIHVQRHFKRQPNR